jgi:hypothetical protein
MGGTIEQSSHGKALQMPVAISSLLSRVGAALLLVAIVAAPVQAEILLRLSQPLYEVGQPVSFRLSNESKWVITLPNAIGWWHISDSQRTLVGGCQIQPTTVELYPGYWFEDTWDQTVCIEGSQVSPGFYYLEVTYHSECCPGDYTITVRFEIGAAPVEPVTWGRVKAIFRAD